MSYRSGRDIPAWYHSRYILLLRRVKVDRLFGMGAMSRKETPRVGVKHKNKLTANNVICCYCTRLISNASSGNRDFRGSCDPLRQNRNIDVGGRVLPVLYARLARVDAQLLRWRKLQLASGDPTSTKYKNGPGS